MGNNFVRVTVSSHLRGGCGTEIERDGGNEGVVGVIGGLNGRLYGVDTSTSLMYDKKGSDMILYVAQMRIEENQLTIQLG